jgi:hypothetical protein
MSKRKKFFLLTLGLVTGRTPKRAGRSGVRPRSLHFSSSSSWKESSRGMMAGVEVEGRTWNLPTALAAGWTATGSGTRSGTAAGDSCTENN